MFVTSCVEFGIGKYHLKPASLLDFLSPREAEMIKEKLERKEFFKGEYIFKENTYSRGVYIVRKGKIKIFQSNAEGKQSILYFYRRGDFFGHRPILGNEPHPGSAVCMDNVVLSYLAKDHFLKLIEDSDNLAKKLLANLAKEFSVWMNKTTLFAQYGVKKRVALSLLILNQIYERRDSAGKRTVISINRDDFASYVGTAKETLVRMLRYFKDEGIIASSRTNIIVLRPRALTSMVEDM